MTFLSVFFVGDSIWHIPFGFLLPLSFRFVLVGSFVWVCLWHAQFGLARSLRSLVGPSSLFVFVSLSLSLCVMVTCWLSIPGDLCVSRPVVVDVDDVVVVGIGGRQPRHRHHCSGGSCARSFSPWLRRRR